MSYISPIKIGEIQQMEEGWADKIGRYIAGEVDNLVLESCVKVGCHVDKDELEKALRYDRDQYSKGYADGKRDAAPRWHSMEDNGPPEEKGPYFVYAPSYRGGSSSGKESARGVMISKWTGKHWSIEVGYYERPGCVTHWMPIEPPKEDA